MERQREGGDTERHRDVADREGESHRERIEEKHRQ